MPELEHPQRILLAEDDEGDAFITRRGFRKAAPDVELTHVCNGADCLKYLRKQPPYESAKTPDLLLLDVNMPVMDGMEVMKEISSDERLCRLPVIVLTTSRAEHEINSMYSLGCASFITKPVDFNDFHAAVAKICGYWFQLVALPDQSQA